MKQIANGLYLSVLAIAFASGIALADESALRARIEALDARIALDLARTDLLYEKCDLLEKAGDYEEARSVAGIILEREESYAVHIRLGWLNLKCGGLPDAERHYRAAAERSPDSVEPWLGLQLVGIAREDWREAERAGEAALAVDLDSYWAVSRQAYATFMLEEYARAETLYRRGLEIRPGEPEMLLGLGFTRIHRGAAEEGRELCRRAGEQLAEDPRVAECLDLADRAAHKVIDVSAAGTYMDYDDSMDLGTLKSLTAIGAVRWPRGYGLWLGTIFSETALRNQAEDFWQVSAVAKGFFSGDRWFVEAGGGWLASNDDTIDDTALVLIESGYGWKTLGVEAGVALSVYQDFEAVQVDAAARFSLGDRITLRAGPELIVIGAYERQGPGPLEIDVESLWSIHLDIDWRVTNYLTFSGSGYYGPRRYALDLDGLSVWTNSDLFIGAYDVVAFVGGPDRLQLILAFHHKFGEEQHYVEDDFSLLGASVGLRRRF